jgi:UDP-2-acetamido-3-amino-2,3-dideoxy-glucuronate N-acetyltransferase
MSIRHARSFAWSAVTISAREVEPDPSAGLVHATAEVDAGAVIGPNTRIWSGVQVREGARIGAECTLGKGVYIDRDVVVGDRVKLQNRASVFRGSRIESGVFIGPHSCLLNDKRPRATNGHGSLKADPDWHAAGVTVRRGASIGGGCTVLPGVSVGEYAMVGAGSVVTKDVPPHGLVVGNPARVVGTVCNCGTRIARGDTCADCGWTNTLEAQLES